MLYLACGTAGLTLGYTNGLTDRDFSDKLLGQSLAASMFVGTTVAFKALSLFFLSLPIAVP